MRRDGPSDKTILRRARQGDRESFLTLLRRYDPRLRRLALRLLADPSRLDRVLSRAYVKAWRSVPFVKRSEPAARWLHRIVYNACINELRWEPVREAPPALEGDPVPLPAASTERRLLALRALRPTERIPLVLVDGEGMSLDDTARMMRRDPGEVALDLARARGQWRAYVCGDPEPLPEPALTVDLAADRPSPAGSATTPVPGLGPEPTLAPSPAATLAKLAALAAPTAPREPVGHVRLLAATPGDHTPPHVAAKPPPTARREPDPFALAPEAKPSPDGDSSVPPDAADRAPAPARKPGPAKGKAPAAGRAGRTSRIAAASGEPPAVEPGEVGDPAASGEPGEAAASAEPRKAAASAEPRKAAASAEPPAADVVAPAGPAAAARPPARRPRVNRQAAASPQVDADGPAYQVRSPVPAKRAPRRRASGTTGARKPTPSASPAAASSGNAPDQPVTAEQPPVVPTEGEPVEPADQAPATEPTESVGAAGDDGAAAPQARPGPSSSSDGGAGARRKRRREATRPATSGPSRPRGGAASESVAPAPEPTNHEDRERDAG